MNIALYVLAGALALVFLLSGVQKLIRTREELAAAGFTFVEDLDDRSVKGIGVLEILAAAGLVLPAALDVLPVLVPLAAVGLVLLMVGAAAVHRRRGENPAIVVNLALLTLAAFVAVGRFGPESLSS